jgi:hypothetical protein
MSPHSWNLATPLSCANQPFQGDGTRGGTGKCECDRGYVGVMCSNCDAHYFVKENNATFIECEGNFRKIVRKVTIRQNRKIHQKFSKLHKKEVK